MKPADIKNLLRYGISKAQEGGLTISVSLQSFNLLFNGEKWEPLSNEVCPLSALLLLRQIAPSAQLLEEFGTSPETLAAETVRAILESSREFVYGIMDGCHSIDGKFIKPAGRDGSEGFLIGQYLHTRLTKE